MRIELWRDQSNDKNTHGTLYIEGYYECRTLEDVVREIPGQPVEQWKIPGQTAIPAGVYDIEMHLWEKHDKEYPMLKDVPGFTGIYIHGGITADDTEGCILTGTKYDVNDEILNSQAALADVKKQIKAELVMGGKVQIEIRNYMSA